jgi:hypothetical protein
MLVEPLLLLTFLNIPQSYENMNNQDPALSSKLIKTTLGFNLPAACLENQVAILVSNHRQ